MTTHVVKSWPKFFNPILAGTRCHELRRNDRQYVIGDQLVLQEFEPDTGEYTGRECTVVVTSLTSAEQVCAVSDEALHRDFCILSVKVLSKIG